MIRFLLILLLAAVVLKQASPCLDLKTGIDSTELCSLGDENENEKAKADTKGQNEDKLHHYDLHLYGVLHSLTGSLAQGAQQLYQRFYDQPNTPPPNFG